jgi:hypothetical protein
MIGKTRRNNSQGKASIMHSAKEGITNERRAEASGASVLTSVAV